MAGAGFDAAMIRDAAAGSRTGSAAPPTCGAGLEEPAREGFGAKIKVDGVSWYTGRASCVLVGNVGELFGGVEAFADAEPDDGVLELGIVTAEGVVQWTRTIARTVVATPSESPFVRATKARTVKVKLDRKVLLRARRRRPQQGQVIQGAGRAGVDQRLCSRPRRGDD